MATQQKLAVVERDDPVITVTATRDGAPVDLTSLDIEAVIKASTGVDDSTGTVLTLADGVTVTDATNGVLEVHIPSTAIASPGKQAYHVTLLDGGLRHTVLYGDLVITDI